MQKKYRSAFLAAFLHTIPIMTGFLFLGTAYGIYMNASGFSPLYPLFMSLFIFAGSMEFVAVNLLMGGFDPIDAFLLTLLVNARHLFYGISMLDKYSGTGKLKPYLIFGMCDESFSINLTADVPDGVDKGLFMFFVTLLNHFYWVFGATLGGIIGSVISLNLEGLEFVMTALLYVLFLEQLLKEKDYQSALIGIVCTVLCLAVFGSDGFIVPSMILILLCMAVRMFLKRGEQECP
ncbi:MAG: AzlC family ABC transporter permease [Eubacteriales bacterium]|nr:AzlC family ABC transporter permease [Eubacteriales bacterium]